MISTSPNAHMGFRGRGPDDVVDVVRRVACGDLRMPGSTINAFIDGIELSREQLQKCLEHVKDWEQMEDTFTRDACGEVAQHIKALLEQSSLL